jgi:hypothetical protein
MPTYDYFCEANDRKVEVSHKMSENLTNWGELCERAGQELGDTAADTPVKRLATGGNIINSSSRNEPAPACATGACCPGGMCGLPE